MKRAPVLLLVLALSAPACGGGGSGGGSEDVSADAPVTPPEVTFTIADQGVTDIPQDIAAGVTTVSVTNDGKDGHFPAWARINDGVDPTKVGVALAEGDFGTFFSSAVVAGAVFTPGENNLLPGQTGSLTTELTEGSYILVDPEAKKFEPGYFEVGPATGDDVEEPEADATIDEGEYFIEVGELSSGTSTIALTNAGEQGHELIVSEKKTEKEAGFAFAPAPGQTSWIELDLKPGTYVFACYFPDVKNGKMGKKNHAQLGMETTVTVE